MAPNGRTGQLGREIITGGWGLRRISPNLVEGAANKCDYSEAEMEIGKREFLQRTFQLAAATNLGWLSAACSSPQPGNSGSVASRSRGGKRRLKSTEWLGDVTLTPQQLKAMQAGPYILHARAGKLNRVPAEKTLLPHDPQGHVQMVEVALAPDKTIYVNQNTLMCRSSDGGRSWDLCPRQEKMGGSFQILGDGTFIAARNAGEKDQSKILVWRSADQGRTWKQISEIENPAKCAVRHSGALCRLSDDTLVLPVESRAHMIDPAYVHRSSDGGRTWSGPTGFNTEVGYLGGHCYENMIAPTVSGKLVAVIRYHGAVVPQWPLIDPAKHAFYKTVFLADSSDGGKTWHHFRPLTNVHGQCHGFGVGFPDGTFVVSYDHRYPRDLSSGRAMISYDEGETWQEEVYYLYYGDGISGFSQSLVLDDGWILTVGGISHELESRRRWAGATGKSELWAIRWKPVRA